MLIGNKVYFKNKFWIFKFLSLIHFSEAGLKLFLKDNGGKSNDPDHYIIKFKISFYSLKTEIPVHIIKKILNPVIYTAGECVMHSNNGNIRNYHCVKVVRVWSYSGSYFPTFWLNMKKYGVSLRIQFECRKMWTKITPNTDTLHAVHDFW